MRQGRAATGVFVSTRGVMHANLAAFEKAVQKVPGCLECLVVTGELDYFVVLRTQDNESFNRLHAAELLYLPGVRQIRTFVVLKQVLSTTELAIG